MKTDSPYDRGDIHINKNDKVLEIGPGHNPTYRSNVIAEKFIDTNYHRCVNPAKRKAMAVKNEKRFLKQKRNALKNPGYSHHPVKTQASFKRLLKAV